MTPRIANVISAVAVASVIVGIAAGTATAASQPLTSVPSDALLTASSALHEIKLTSNDTSDRGSVFYTGQVKCPTERPYLVLDAVADNARHYLRNATYHTGDGKNLVLNPLSPEYVIPVRHDSANYNAADVRFQVLRNGFHHPGHEELTVYCAATATDAHQGWT